MPYARPSEAGFYTPPMPSTRYKTHLNPFWRVLPALQVQTPRLPKFPEAMRPGNLGPGSAPAGAIRQALPEVPGVTVPAGAGPVSTPTPTAPAAMSNKAAAMLRMRSGGMDPYRVMRSGNFPGIQSNGVGLRRGITSTGGVIKRLMPASYPGNVPAGSYV